MKYLLMICFIFCAGFAAAAPGNDCTQYMDQTYRYSVCVPHTWSKSYREGDNANVLRLARKNGAKITLSASRFEGDGMKKWENPGRWYARSIGSGFRKVIESKNIEVGGNVAIKVLLFDFFSRAGKTLQRTMLMKYGDTLLTVDCRAPLWVFAKYTNRFDAVMSSVDVSGELEGEQMALLKSPERKPVAKARKQRKPRPEPKPIPITKPEPEIIVQPAPITEQEPAPAEEITPEADSGTSKANKPDATIPRIERVTPEAPVKKAEEPKPVTETRISEQPVPEPVTDPATRTMIDDERKKLQELEEKGIIEKVEEE